jgi:hypothetical protein
MGWLRRYSCTARKQFVIGNVLTVWIYIEERLEECQNCHGGGTITEAIKKEDKKSPPKR